MKLNVDIPLLVEVSLWSIRAFGVDRRISYTFTVLPSGHRGW